MRTGIKSLFGVASAFVLMLAFVALQVLGATTTHAAVGEAVWTGAGTDNKFSTAANWQGGVLPVAGNMLVFNTEPVAEKSDLNNDLDVVFGGVKSEGGQNNESYKLSSLKLQDGSTWNTSEHIRVSTYAKGVQVDGSINVVQGSPVDLSASGTVTLQSGVTLTYAPTAKQLVVKNGAMLICLNKSINYPVTLGGGNGSIAKLSFSGCGGAAGGNGTKQTSITYNISEVTLMSNAQVAVYSPNTVKVAKLTKNGHSLTRVKGADGTLITPDGKQTNSAKTTKLNGNKPNETVILEDKETAILNGEREYIYVGYGATLMGNGTVGVMSVAGTVSPGNSPGKITVKESLYLFDGSIFDAQILNKSSYDQLVAGTVSIGGSKLQVSLLANGKVTKGDKFTIINNEGEDPIEGTFAGLAEGAKITIGKAVFVISYKGGVGSNDVVLTALTTASAPGTPNTGFAPIVTANPVLVAVAGIVAASTLVVVAKRRK